MEKALGIQEKKPGGYDDPYLPGSKREIDYFV